MSEEESDITITITADTCTITINPDAYLRVKVYYPGPPRRVPCLQGKSFEWSNYEKRATMTFPKPALGESLRLGIYNGDGEGGDYAEYTVEEGGLVLRQAQLDYHITIITQ